MAEIGSLAVSLSMDASKFNGTVSQVDRNLRAMGGELQAIKARGADYGKSVEGLAKKQDVLNRSFDAAKIKLEEQRKKYDELVASGKATDAQIERQAIAVNKAQTEYSRLETELKDVTQELKVQSSQFTQTGRSIQDFGGKLKTMGDGAVDVGKKLSVTVTAPILAVGTAVTKTAADFEAQMDRVGAIAGATGDEISKLSETAMELGANTSKSAKEVAVGMEEMAAMGFEVNEIIGAMPGVIAAAEASGSDMAQTAEVMASTLNIFGKEASEASKVADILAKTANISAADLTDMQYALKYAGPPAAALGISLEETAAAIGLMTNAGMKGEQAGTTLRGALLGLLSPSEDNSKLMSKMGIEITDLEGNFVGLSKLVKNMTVAMDGLTETEKAAYLAKLVGKEAVSGMLTLMKSGPDVIDEMTKSLENSGGASAEAAAKMKDNLKGALEELGGSIETASIQLGNILIPVVRDAAEWIQGLVEKFSELSPEAQRASLVIGGLAAAVGPVLVVGGTLVSSIGSIVGAVGGFSMAIGAAGGATTAFGATLSLISGPVGWAVLGAGAIAALGGTLVALRNESELTTEEMIKLQEESFNNATSAHEQASALNDLATEYETLRDKSNLTTVSMLDFLELQKEIENTTSPDKIAELTAKQQELIDKSGLSNEEFERMIKLDGELQSSVEGVQLAFDEKGNAVIKYSGAVKEATNAQLELAKAELAATMMDNLFGMAEAQEKIVIAVEKQEEAHKNSLKYLAEINGKNAEINILKSKEESINKKIADNARLSVEYDSKRVELNNEINKLQNELNTASGEERKIIQDKRDALIAELDTLREQENSRIASKGALDLELDALGRKLVEENNILAELEGQKATHDGIYEEQTKEIANLNKLIALANNEHEQYLNILAEEVGITAEQGKQLQQMKNLQSDNSKLIAQLEQKKKTEQGITAEEQRQLDELKKHNTQISNNIAEAEELNVILGEDIKKDVNIDDKGAADNLNERLSRPITRYINIIENKGYTPAYAKGTNHHPGGRALVGELGAELAIMPGGRQVMLGVDGPGIFNLPTGTKVLTHTQTMSKLSTDLDGMVQKSAIATQRLASSVEGNAVVYMPTPTGFNRTGQSKASTPVHNHNYARMMEGAIFHVREDADIEKIAIALGGVVSNQMRRNGVKR